MDAPVAPPRVVRQRRVRPGLLGLAVLLIALGGLGAAFAVTSVRATGSYLAVARPVEVGRQLSADDLVAVQVAGGQGLRPVPAGRLDEVVGKRAAVALTPGTLLTLAQLTDDPLLGPGQQQIALGLKPAPGAGPRAAPRRQGAAGQHPGRQRRRGRPPPAPGSRPPSSTWPRPAQRRRGGLPGAGRPGRAGRGGAGRAGPDRASC